MNNSSRNEPYLFNIKKEIGVGGFGRVYTAHVIFDEEDQLVALKVLKREEMDENTLQRFEREIRIHTQLQHSNIVPIIDFKLNDAMENEVERGLAYYTMPLARKNLRDFLKDYRENHLQKMDDATVIYYFSQILDGIEYAHEKSIIHRDLKPENVLIYEEGNLEKLKISDFGLGKFLNGETRLTQTQIALGSDIYAAPEQYVNSKEVDEKADIYALGKILYELITQDLPVTIDQSKIQNTKLYYIIRKATKHNSDERFRSVKEMRDRIDLIMGDKHLMKNSASRFQIAYEKYNDHTDHRYLIEVAEILNNSPEDYILYTQNFMNLDKADISQMKSNNEDALYEAIENFLNLTNGNHDFNLTDKIANFIFCELVPNIDNNIDLYEKAIECVLKLAYNHNRYYIARLFGKEISKIENENLTVMVGEVIMNNKREVRWVKEFFSEHHFCEYLVRCFADAEIEE